MKSFISGLIAFSLLLAFPVLAADQPNLDLLIDVDKESAEEAAFAAALGMKLKRVERITKFACLSKIEDSNGTSLTKYYKRNKRSRYTFLGNRSEAYESGEFISVFWKKKGGKLVSSIITGPEGERIVTRHKKAGVDLAKLTIPASLDLDIKEDWIKAEVTEALDVVRKTRSARKLKETKFTLQSFSGTPGAYDYVIVGDNSRNPSTFIDGVLQ